MEIFKSFLLLENLKTTIGLLVSSGISYFCVRKWSQIRKENQEKKERPLRLVVITGCDSGLGLSMACWAAQMGYKVFAGCLNLNSDGANYLRKEFDASTMFISQLDVTDDSSIEHFKNECEKILDSDKGRIKLWAVISNAAILVIGEFFWQTQDQWERQMKVNFWGCVKLTSMFKELLFQHKCRLIVTTSDCSHYALPCLSTYCASKAALEGWAKSLRYELGKYGILVTCYEPGSFSHQSRLALFEGPLKEMEEAMNPKDKMFYGSFLQTYTNIQTNFSRKLPPVKPMVDVRRQMDLAYLLEGNIKYMPVYLHKDFDQYIIHFIQDYFPGSIKDKLICKMIYMNSEWSPREYPQGQVEEDS